MSKKIFSCLAVFAMAFTVMASSAFAAPAPVPGTPSWDKKYQKAEVVAPTSGPVEADGRALNPRQNASGDKIASNAHSADFPGLYFYWDDKQKDNGVLLVDPEVFDLFVDGGFTLTAKNSNNYWGYRIDAETGTLIDGVYAYGIAKQFQWVSVKNGKAKQEKEDLKNINMVFIDGEYKSGYLEIVKKWQDERGKECEGDNDLVSFQGGYKLGVNEIKIRDYAEAINGRKITVTENPIKGFEALANPQSVVVPLNKDDDEPTAELTFVNQKQWAYITIVKVWLDEEGYVIEDTEGLFAGFSISLGDRSKNGFKATTYRLKEGTYTVSEVCATEGYELVSDNDVEVTVAAGETETVEFTNRYVGVPEFSGYAFSVPVWFSKEIVNKAEWYDAFADYSFSFAVYKGDVYLGDACTDADGDVVFRLANSEYADEVYADFYLDDIFGDYSIVEYADGWWTDLTGELAFTVVATTNDFGDIIGGEAVFADESPVYQNAAADVVDKEMWLWIHLDATGQYVLDDKGTSSGSHSITIFPGDVDGETAIVSGKWMTAVKVSDLSLANPLVFGFIAGNDPNNKGENLVKATAVVALEVIDDALTVVITIEGLNIKAAHIGARPDTNFGAPGQLWPPELSPVDGVYRIVVPLSVINVMEYID